MKVDILSPVHFNGKALAVGGAPVEMPRDDAAPLIAAGAAMPHDAKAAAAAKADAKVAAEQVADPVAVEKAAAAALADDQSKE